MFSTLPNLANQVSVQPPKSAIRIGATLLMIRDGLPMEAVSLGALG